MGIGKGGVQLKSLPQVGDRLLVHALIVEDLAQRVVDRRALRIDLTHPLEPPDGALQLAAALLGVAELHQRARVARALLNQRFVLADRLLHAPRLQVAVRQPKARLIVLRVGL